MVRLKDNRSNKTFAQFQIISIPYGAIKSFNKISVKI